MKRRRYTEAELIWAAYCEAPSKDRLVASYDEMPETARAIWRPIVKRLLASGWVPTNSEPGTA